MSPHTLAFGWWTFLGVFALILGVLVLLAAARALSQWARLYRAGHGLPFGTYLRLRWRGLDVPAIAAAHWTTRAMGREADLEDWISFSMLGVDVARLAAAMGVADEAGVQVSLGTLAAAALAGYDGVEVVRAAADRGLGALAADDLRVLPTWGLVRKDRPA